MDMCKYCGREAYGDKHRECELGSPQDREDARRAMQGPPDEDAPWIIKGPKKTKQCIYQNTKRLDDESQDICNLDGTVCFLSLGLQCDMKEEGE